MPKWTSTVMICLLSIIIIIIIIIIICGLQLHREIFWNLWTYYYVLYTAVLQNHRSFISGAAEVMRVPSFIFMQLKPNNRLAPPSWIGPPLENPESVTVDVTNGFRSYDLTFSAINNNMINQSSRIPILDSSVENSNSNGSWMI